MKNKLIISMFLLLIHIVFATFTFSQDNLSLYVDRLGSESSRSERNQAFEKLEEAGKKAVPLLINALDSEDNVKREKAIVLLYAQKASDAVPRLIELLNGDDKQMKLVSAYALGNIGDKRATDPVLQQLKITTDEDFKRAALMGLGFLGDKKAVPYIENELKNPNQTVRPAAASALGLLGNSGGLREALEGTHNDNGHIQIAAVEALGAIGDKSALTRLHQMMDDPAFAGKNQVQIAINQIEIHGMPPGQNLAALKQFLYDKNTGIVTWAIFTLAELGTPEALSLLEEKAQAGKDKECYLAMRRLKAARGR